jgi:ribosomal protein S18 acetylase RimI-like enzyme
LTAAVTAGRPKRGHGLRRFDPGRDLSALADLIEAGFAERLDPSGRRMVRGLRLFGKLGWLGGLLGRWFLPPAANPQGFVWEEQGAVIGNASLLPVTNYSQRWVMANVVVLPERRRRGIGRTLVTRSIEHARSRGAREIILQVDLNNEAATALYLGLGFKAYEPRTTWIWGWDSRLTNPVQHG